MKFRKNKTHGIFTFIQIAMNGFEEEKAVGGGGGFPVDK